MYNQPTHVWNVDHNHIIHLEKLNYTYKILCLPSEFDNF